MFGGKPVWKKKIPLQPIASLKSIFVSSRIHSSLFWLVILLPLLFHSLVFSTLTAISSVNQKNWSAVLYGPHFYRFHAIRKTYLTKMLPWHETKASNTLKKTTKHLIYIYYTVFVFLTRKLPKIQLQVIPRLFLFHAQKKEVIIDTAAAYFGTF